MKIRFSRYLIGVFLFTLLMSTLPMIVLGIFSYSKSSDIIQNKVNEANMQNLLSTQFRVEQTLKIIDNLVLQFANSSIVTSSMKKALTPADFEIVNEASSDLNRLQTYELGIEDAFLLNMDNDWLIYNSGLSKLSDSMDKNQLAQFVNLQKTSFWIKERISNINYVSLIKKLPTNSLKPQGLLIIRIPDNKITGLLSKNDMLGKVLILDSTSNVLANEDQSMQGKDLSSTPYIMEIKRLGTPYGQFLINIDRNDLWVTFSQSSYNGWMYLSIVPIKEMTSDSKEIGLLTLIVSAGILLVACLISMRGTRRIYFPIHNLYESVKTVVDKNIAVKGEDEFKFIRQRIHKMITERTEMGGIIQGQVEQLKEFFILKLIQGGVKQEEIKEKLSLYGFSPSWKWLCVLVLEVDTLEGTKFKDKDNELVMFAINNIVSELMSAENTPKPVLLGQHQITLIASNHETVEAFKYYIFSIAEMIQKTVYNCLSVKVNIGISRPYNQFIHTQVAFREGIEALKYRVRLDSESVLYIEDVLPDYHPHAIFPKDSELELIDAIKLVDVERANELLNNCIKEIFKEKSTRSDYQISLVRLLMDIIRVAQELKDSFYLKQSDNKSVFDQLFELKTEQEIKHWFRNTILKPIMQLLEEHRKIQYKDITEKIIHIIHQEYDTDLTLMSCAYRFNYHPNHISRVFKSETGVNFKDYLSQYRLRIAKKWLVETEMKVTEIAARLQYNNAQNFIRYFKQMEGVTPGKYCEMNRMR